MRVLLAVDGSATSDMAAAVITASPWPSGTTVRVVSVLPRSSILPLDWFMPPGGEVDERPDPEDRYRRATDRAERALREHGLRVESVLLTGRPGSAIVDEATDFLADVVVLGSRGHGPWETLVLGSVSAEVVDHAPCPVLVVRTPFLDPIVLAHDDSPSAHRAEEVLAAWPTPPGAVVHVVTVVEQPVPLTPILTAGLASELPEWAVYDREASLTRSRLIATAAAERLSETGLDASAELAEGGAAEEVVAATRRHGAGLVVLGTRGHGGVTRLLLGSVARNVLLHASCSVLVVRPQLARIGSVPALAGTESALVAG